MKQIRAWFALVAAAVGLVACGGGGGSAGTSVFNGTGSGTSSGSGSGATANYAISVDVQRSGTSTSQISSTETVQAVATVTDRSGSPVQGVVVSFSESAGASLLSFQPGSATALTDASGKASVDISAKDPTSTGATTVSASGSVAGTAVTGQKSIAVAASAVSTPTPAAIQFVSSSAGTQAIVVKGAGGSGRAESAILTFTIVDATGAPINGTKVNFALNADSGGATISPSSALSDSSGKVTTTVASGTQPATIVVTATSDAVPTVSVQSSSLIVSNSVPVAGGFEIVAAKYNLDGQKTGDSTTISAFVRDQFGNPVPDGIAVSFSTDYGAVASSTLGGCTTVNGTCNVDFRVEDPRGTGLATVVGTVRVGNSTVLSQSLNINMAEGPYIAYRSNNGTLVPVTSEALTQSCKQTYTYLLADGNGRSVPAGTKIEVDLTSSNLAATVKSGSPVLDQLGGFAPTNFGLEIDATSSSLSPACNAAGAGTGSGFLVLKYTTPNNIVYSQRIDITYPK